MGSILTDFRSGFSHAKTRQLLPNAEQALILMNQC